MQAKGIPPKVVNDFLKTYGMGRVGKAKATMGYFKDYGLSDKALQTIGRGFNAETIEIIQNTYMRSKVFYSGTDTDLILILFKQAGSSGAASTLSNSLITLGNSGIVPSAFGEYGIISSISGMSPAVTALSTGITPALMKKLFGFGIRPTDYDGYGIVGADSAETVAEAVEMSNSLKTISKLDEALEAIESVSFRGLDDTRITTMLKNIDDGAMSVSDKVTTKAKLFNKALDDGVVLPDMQVVKSASFVDEVGNVKWPDKNGFVIDEITGFPIMEEVNPKKGFVFDRYGTSDGRFVSPVENGVSVSYDQRSLPYIENPNAYHKYEVIKDFNELPDAIQNCTDPALKNEIIDYMSRYSIEFDDLKIFKGEIAPAFDATGGGTQLQFPLPVDFLNRLGIIKELF